MATVLNRTQGNTFPYEKDIRYSANTPDFPEVDWIINPDLSAVEGFSTRYWDISGDSVLLVDAPTRDARDQEYVTAGQAADEQRERERYDQEAVLRAVVKLLVDELNILRNQHSLTPRTYEQVRAAILAAIGDV